MTKSNLNTKMGNLLSLGENTLLGCKNPSGNRLFWVFFWLFPLLYPQAQVCIFCCGLPDHDLWNPQHLMKEQRGYQLHVPLPLWSLRRALFR